MRVHIMLVSLGLIVGSAAMASAEPSGAGSQSVRSGTIVTGLYIPHQGLGPVPTCDAVPSCAAWRASGCNAALATRGTSADASIVNVRDLANGRTRRSFSFSGAFQWGTVTVQLWRSDCTAISEGRSRTKFPSRGAYCTLGRLGRQCGDPTFVIPKDAAWMTVTVTADNVDIDWTLT